MSEPKTAYRLDQYLVQILDNQRAIMRALIFMRTGLDDVSQDSLLSPAEPHLRDLRGKLADTEELLA